MLVASSHADSLDFILFLPQESLPSLQYNKDNLVFVYSDQSSEKVHLKNSTAMCLSINSFHWDHIFSRKWLETNSKRGLWIVSSKTHCF